MDFIENEEAQHLQPSASPHFPTPVPTHPFPFLHLPREIRDSIYHYALLHPNTGPSVYPTHTCYIQKVQRGSTASRLHWGTEYSTRLFRVNRQISHEALELFYSTYPFHFPQWVDVALVNATARDTLSPWARRLINKIGFMFNIRCTPGPFTLSDEEERRRAIEAVIGLLPNVKSVVLTLCFVGLEVPDYQAKEVVARALKIASPLRNAPGLVLKGASDQNAQRTRMLREIRDGLGCL